MEILHFNKYVRVERKDKSTLFEFSKDMVLLQPRTFTNKFINTCNSLQVNSNEFCEILPINEVIPAYNDKSKNIIIQRTSGIGDLIALSSLCLYLAENNKRIFFSTQEKFKEIFDWFKCDIKLCDILKPLPFKYDKNYKLRPKIFSILEYEGKIESTNKNWFELFYKEVSKTIDLNEWGRPILRTDRISQLKSRIDLNEDSLLLCLKASVDLRSINLESIYDCLPKDKKIYIHEDSLSIEDKKYIEHKGIKNLNIIKAESISEFLLDLYDAKNVICTDTGATHFREGIQKPCIALFAPFTADCRTKYYKYVKSFDIVSDCKYQPCYRHCDNPNEKCINGKPDIENSPCLNSKHNKTLKIQLINIFKDIK